MDVKLQQDSNGQKKMFWGGGLSCERQGRLLFENLHFSLESGATMVLVGANGIGKSSLLSMMAGLLPVYKGSIVYRERMIKSTADFEGDVVYIGHKNAVKPEATVRENIFFWAQMSGNSSLAAMAMEYFSLGPWLDLHAGSLSAGWQRRLALTRLLTMPAKLWLLDEPTNNLDAEGVALLGELLRTRTQSGGAVVMVSHGVTVADANADLQVLDMEQFKPKEKEEV